MINTDYLRFIFSRMSYRATRVLSGLGVISAVLGVLLFIRGSLSIEGYSLIIIKPIDGLPEISGLMIIFGFTLILGKLQNFRGDMLTGRLISKLSILPREICTLIVSLVISLFFGWVGYNLIAYSLTAIPKNFFLHTTSSPILLPSILLVGMVFIFIPLVHRIILSTDIIYCACKLNAITKRENNNRNKQ